MTILIKSQTNNLIYYNLKVSNCHISSKKPEWNPPAFNSFTWWVLNSASNLGVLYSAALDKSIWLYILNPHPYTFAFESRANECLLPVTMSIILLKP